MAAQAGPGSVHRPRHLLVATRATTLLRSLDGIGEDERWNYYHTFGM
jgi:hypothetical protein